MRVWGEFTKIMASIGENYASFAQLAENIPIPIAYWVKSYIVYEPPLGFIHRAERCRPGTTRLSSPVCRIWRDAEGFLERGWGPFLLGWFGTPPPPLLTSILPGWRWQPISDKPMGWGFHIVRDGVDAGDHRYRSHVVVVDIRGVSEAGMEPYLPRVRRNCPPLVGLYPSRAALWSSNQSSGISQREMGSAPQAADAVRHARARKNTNKTCKGTERRGPWCGANSKLMMPRAARAVLIALCCAVCLLAVSRSDRQYGCNLRGGGAWGPREINWRKSKNTGTQHVDTGTWVRYFVSYQVFHFIPDTAVCSRERTAQNDTAPHCKVRHGTARRCAVLLSYL